MPRRFLHLATLLLVMTFSFGSTAPSAPVLSISRTQPFVLFWPTNHPGFELETKTNLTSPWQLWSTRPVIVGTNFAITNVVGDPDPNDAMRYFRLSNHPQFVCRNQLLQIGLAFAVWTIDSGDRYPFEVPIALGGTREWRAIGPDGFDTNAFHHFQAISNELNNAALLVCRGDVWRQAVTNFAILAPSNVTYKLRTSDDVITVNTGAVMCVCPIDGNTLFVSGAVKMGTNN